VARHSHIGCSWIVDQLIGIRDLEQRLIAAFAAGDQRCGEQLRFGVAELNRWLDRLEQALDAFAPPGLSGRYGDRYYRCFPRNLADKSDKYVQPAEQALGAARDR
jgi:hypothetical protein